MEEPPAPSDEHVGPAASEPAAPAPEPIPAPTGASPSNPNALRLVWTFGFNKELVNGVHNLSSDSRRALFYTSAHTGVIYDYAERQQKLVQDHCHPISCCVVSEDKRWIVDSTSLARSSSVLVYSLLRASS